MLLGVGVGLRLLIIKCSNKVSQATINLNWRVIHYHYISVYGFIINILYPVYYFCERVIDLYVNVIIRINLYLRFMYNEPFIFIRFIVGMDKYHSTAKFKVFQTINY